MTTAILQLICPDHPCLVSRLSGWIASHNGNIRHADHHTDEGAGMFLSRLEWDLHGFSLNREEIHKQILELANNLGGKAQLSFSDEIPRVAIFVSKQSHCLVDILWLNRSAELPMHVPLVIANHKNLELVCQDFGVIFKYVPIQSNNKKLAIAFGLIDPCSDILNI